MSQKLSDKQKLDAIFTLVVGVAGTSAGGVIKTLDEIAMHLKELNGAVKINTTWRKVFAWAISIIFTALILLIGYLSNHNV